MADERIVFWVLAATATVVAGWRLSVRPGAHCRDVASPVAFLLLVLVVLLCMLTLSGESLQSVSRGAYALVVGG